LNRLDRQGQLGLLPRQSPDQARHIRLRSNPCNELLDLPHAPMPGSPKNLLVIVFGEVRSKQVQPAQMKLPTPDHSKNAGKTCGRAATSDSLHSNRLRHVKALNTEGEHRRTGMLEIQLSPIDLGNIGRHGGHIPTISFDQRGEVAEQPMLVEVTNRGSVDHEAKLTRGFKTQGRATRFRSAVPNECVSKFESKKLGANSSRHNTAHERQSPDRSENQIETPPRSVKIIR